MLRDETRQEKRWDKKRKGGRFVIDIHSHILFGLDDGARTEEETLEMARQAVQDGVSAIVATPHHRDGTYENPPEVVRARCAEVQALLDRHQIPLRVLPGMEIRARGDEISEFEMGRLLTYNDKKRHLLLELPHDHAPRYVEQLVFDLQVAGYVPIVAHPERNREIARDPNVLYRWVRQGAMAQLTAASVSGKLGRKLQKTCFTMIEHQLVHFVASDAHNAGSRGPILSEAYSVIEAKFGADYVLMYKSFAERIAQGLDCPVEPATKVKARFFGIF